MDQIYELRSLAAETLAIQAILIGVLGRISTTKPDLQRQIALGFDDAANYVEHIAIKLGNKAPPEHTIKALKIVEGLRSTTLSKPDKPRRGV